MNRYVSNRNIVKRGMISIAVAVIMMILLTVAMGTLLSCANTLSVAGDKMRYKQNLHMLKSSQNIIVLKVQERFDKAVRDTSEEIRKVYPIPKEELTPEKMTEIAEQFKTLFTRNFYDWNVFSLQKDIMTEDLGGLFYQVKEIKNLKDKGKVSLTVEVKNLSYSPRSYYTVEYRIEMILPDSEDIDHIWENNTDALVEKYQKNLRWELSYSET